ncbi:MAG: hypothetical protein K8T89_03355 [Planctomycetes bacterium]|nr:hypothetical protein [Planctomycetota bacterium]
MTALSRWPGWLIILLALAVTSLNAWKPPVIDDPVYIAYAQEFAAHPSQPYSFVYDGIPANRILVPPVLPAWLALGIPIIGDDPIALKLWLFPIMLLFAGSLFLLLRRFAAGYEWNLTIVTLFSPAILPGINLMLDVPAVAFGMTALALYLFAVDHRSFSLSLAAGIIAGLAMETKYSAFTLPAVFFVHGWLHRQWRFALPAAFVAILTFAGCEAFIAHAQGDSHFMLAMQERQKRQGNPFRLFNALITHFGGLCGALWLIGLTIRGVPRWRIILGFAWILAGFLLLMFVPDEGASLLANPRDGQPLVVLSHLIFVPIGAAFFLMVGGMSRQLWTLSDSANPEARNDRFVVLWLLIEIGGYFTITPFPAVRRILGVLIAATILIGRAWMLQIRHLPSQGWIASSRPVAPQPDSRALSRPVAPQPDSGCGATGILVTAVLVGLVYYAIELREAFAEKRAFHQAVAFVRQQESNASIRAFGNWGFRYQMMKTGIPWSKAAGQDLQPGDWFLHDTRYSPPIHPDVLPHLVLIKHIVIEDGFSLSTQKTYYDKGTPLIHSEKPIAEVFVYRYPSLQ